MFGKRNKGGKDTANACAYCEFINAENAESCSQCYYVFSASARDQPVAEPLTSGNELMSLLLSEDMEVMDEDDYAVEAVLSLEDEAVEISQYETTEQEDSFQLIGGSGPTLAKTIDYVKPEETQLQVSDAPTTASDFILEQYDPLQDVAEPVHSGLGNLYSPMVKTETDEDLLGSVGPKASLPMTPAIPDLPDIIPAKGGLAAAMHQPIAAAMPKPMAIANPSTSAPLPKPSGIPEFVAKPIGHPRDAVNSQKLPAPMATPQLPNQVKIDRPMGSQPVAKVAPTVLPATPQLPISTPIGQLATNIANTAANPMNGNIKPITASIPSPVPANAPAAIPGHAPTAQAPINTVGSQHSNEVAKQQPATPALPGEPPISPASTAAPTPVIAPTPQTNGRIWPWPAKDAWNASQVYREVVSALEQVKSGKLKDAAATLDNLGPHLSVNLDMLLHIGIIMQYLGRTEHLQWTLAMAQRNYPDNEHVSSALSRL